MGVEWGKCDLLFLSFFLSFLAVNILFNFPRSPIDCYFLFSCGKPDQAWPISYMLLDKTPCHSPCLLSAQTHHPR